jgi:hypothetical protein
MLMNTRRDSSALLQSELFRASQQWIKLQTIVLLQFKSGKLLFAGSVDGSSSLSTKRERINRKVLSRGWSDVLQRGADGTSARPALMGTILTVNHTQPFST